MQANSFRITWAAICSAETSTTGEPEAREERDDESVATLSGVPADLVLEATDALREDALELTAKLELLTDVSGENAGASGEESTNGERSARGEEEGDHGLSAAPPLDLWGMGIRACRMSGKCNPYNSPNKCNKQTSATNRQVQQTTNEQATTPHAHATCSRADHLHDDVSL